MGNNEGVEGESNTIGRLTISTKLDPSELTEAKPPTKEYIWAGS